MLKLSDIRLPERQDIEGLRHTAASILGVMATSIKDLQIHRLSIDARRKPDVRFVYTLLVDLDDERAVLAGDIPNAVVYSAPERYVFPTPVVRSPGHPPVIVGTGPAGLFSALCLAEAGISSIILERGSPVEKRVEDVARFIRGGAFDPASNVQFGEGGAGTFSDGKLTTGIGDKRIGFVLERLVQFGAPGDILYLSKPHIGTDKLRGVVRAVRDRLIDLGCDVRFGHTLTDVDISDGVLRGLTVSSAAGKYTLSANTLLLAPGNSARDTFEMLLRSGVKLSAKDFSVGVRIEHLQCDIDYAQYGSAAVSGGTKLPAADYKLAVHLKGGRSVYTFCVCPGGQVVASASEPGGLVTNGMSEYARQGDNCNGALLVTVTPDDFGRSPLDGVRFQLELERAAFTAGGGNYSAPAQLVSDFMQKRASNGRENVRPTYLPGVRYCNLWDVLPGFINEALYEALPELSKRLARFAGSGAVLTAVETRSSCPVRIERKNFEAVGVRGIYPCGEGSGYAGGIMSSAVDGIKCAEQIASATYSAMS